MLEKAKGYSLLDYNRPFSSQPELPDPTMIFGCTHGSGARSA